MSDDEASRRQRGEQSIPPRDIDPAGSHRGVDDHAITPHPRGFGHQDASIVDDAAEREHLTPSWQGVRVEDSPDADRRAPPRESDRGSEPGAERDPAG